MNFTYLIPIYDTYHCYIKSYAARSKKDATEMLMLDLVQKYDLPYPTDFEDLKTILDENEICIGELMEISEF